MASPPSPPPTPNPYAVAAAQTTSNVSTAVANSILQNADEDRPDGSVKYYENGSKSIEEPSYNKDGVVTGTITRVIPKYKRVVSLTPKSQQIFDQGLDIKVEMNAAALKQTKTLNDTLSTPFNLLGLPDRGIVPSPPVVNTSAPGRGGIVNTIGLANFALERQTYLDAIDTRLQWQIQIARDAKILELELSGIYPGMAAYERAMKPFGWESNDANVQAYLKATQEHAARIQIEQVKGTFANNAQNQDFNQRTILIELPNRENLKLFTALTQLATLADTHRQQAMQERVLERAQIVNEISGIVHGNSVQIPQFQGFRPGHISDTPVGQYVYQSAALDQQKWQAQVQQQQQMMGGILSLGGGLLSAGLSGGFGGFGF